MKPQYYVGRLESGRLEAKKTLHPLREPWLTAYGPFKTKRDAVSFASPAERAKRFRASEFR